MNASAAPQDLFAPARGANHQEAAAARARMMAMIARLETATAPPWDTQVAIILDDGAFKRAMRLVPADEAQALWTRFDAQMDRLYAIWAEANLPPEG
jgi:hypothetical protein